MKGEGTLAFAAACFACKVRGRSFKTNSCLRCELQGSATSRHFKSGNLRVRSPQPYGSRKLQIGQIRPKSKEETRTRNFLNVPPRIIVRERCSKNFELDLCFENWSYFGGSVDFTKGNCPLTCVNRNKMKRTKRGNAQDYCSYPENINSLTMGLLYKDKCGKG